MEKQIVAMRGRNPDNPTSRKAGLPTEQRLEPNNEGISNCLTSVTKDNLVMETQLIIKTQEREPHESEIIGTENQCIKKDISQEMAQGYSDTTENRTAGSQLSKSNHEKVNCIGNVNPSGSGINGDVVAAEGLERTITTNKGEGQKICIKQATKQGYIEMQAGGVADLSYPESKTRRGRVIKGGNISPTIQTEGDICKVESIYRIRKLTPKECFRLMDFDDCDFEAAAEVNTNTQLYKQAGNSIVVAVLEAIFRQMI